MNQICSVCGWPHLLESQRSASGAGSHEICPSCGFQPGFDDDDRGHTVASWRAAWIERGMPWSSVARAAPANWNPAQQLKRRRS